MRALTGARGSVAIVRDCHFALLSHVILMYELTDYKVRCFFHLFAGIFCSNTLKVSISTRRCALLLSQAHKAYLKPQIYMWDENSSNYLST
jgi:hypothetical protein